MYDDPDKPAEGWSPDFLDHLAVKVKHFDDELKLEEGNTFYGLLARINEKHIVSLLSYF